MKTLNGLIAALESKLPFIDQKREAISQVSVGWHLEHSLLALIRMITAVEQSNPADYKWKFNLLRSVVFMLGKIPRGKGKAPDASKPGAVITEATIRPLLEKAKEKAAQFEKLNGDKFFNHHVFGALRHKKARRMMVIHTSHHISIINDILKG